VRIERLARGHQHHAQERTVRQRDDEIEQPASPSKFESNVNRDMLIRVTLTSAPFALAAGLIGAAMT